MTPGHDNRRGWWLSQSQYIIWLCTTTQHVLSNGLISLDSIYDTTHTYTYIESWWIYCLRTSYYATSEAESRDL